ncbi:MULTISPECIES: DUF3861 domain-containing protein [Acinetobacter]|jgi:hypothetical protein|uniref:DUF3861 domain-containing protein n=1 Tax=Acinetobacter TaxID=469 RepID=UPI001BCF278F|nr:MULTISPECIES: DUF3861 domain-containing protein [Acinetobacter]MCO8080838.1 DUF3861 domain-containing protein [Acinetobacter lwoffii]
MKQHKYQISVRHLVDPKGQPSTYTEDLVFTAYNHDDIFKVLEKLQQKKIIDEESMKSFAVGLKLMGEVLLENKDIPLFKDFSPQFIEFIKSIKKL